jgi:predicted PurR-regulated permease PerM
MKDLLSAHIRSIGVAARLVIAACLLGLLYFGKVVLIPLALALLIAFGLHPVVRRLVRWHLPRTLAVMAAVMTFLVILGGLSWFIGGQLASFAEELPKYQSNLSERVREGRELFSNGLLERLSGMVNHLISEAGVNTDHSGVSTPAAPSSSAQSWLASAGAVTDPLTTLGLVVILVILLLLQWSEMRGRLLGFMSGNVSHTTQVLADAGRRIGRYLFLQLLYNSGFGLVVGLGLWFLGVPYAGLWGLCAGLFRYLPYVGPLLAAVLPLFVSLMTSSGWSQPGAVFVMFLVLELVSNNFVEPWLYGSKLGVSEIGIILATVAWTYLWGPAGLVLATPLTVCLVVLGTHIPCLSFFAKLLGNESEISDPQKLYQRLLAGDAVEAAELARKHVEEKGASGFISQVLLPALALARRDQMSQWLSNDAAGELTEEVKTLAEEISLPKDTGQSSALINTAPVVVWSACPFMDAALPAVAGELGGAWDKTEVIPSTELVGSALERLKSASVKPAAITVLHLSEVDTGKVTGLVKRICRALDGVPVQVLRVGSAAFSGAEKQQLTDAGAATLGTAPSEGRTWLAAYAMTT